MRASEAITAMLENILLDHERRFALAPEAI